MHLVQSHPRGPQPVRWILAGAAVLLLAVIPATAQEAGTPGQPVLTARQLADFRRSGVPREQLTDVLEALGAADTAAAVREMFKELDPFPAADLVEMLKHPRLRVRSGALDLLEEAVDSTFGFDPWAPDPSAGANARALEEWAAWVSSGKAARGGDAAALGEETFRAMAMEIMTGDRERSECAMQRIEPYGLAAVGYIERFLADQPAIELAAKAALKAVEYRLVLRQSMDRQAAPLARDLASGTPETQSRALDAIAEAGPSVLPITNDLLSSPDALVRETAVDTAFAAGKRAAANLVLDRLAGEQSENVLIAMLRGLGANSNDAQHAEAVARYLTHPSENVVITALEALAHNKEGDMTRPICALLDDPRWRVRAAALETIGARKLGKLSDEVAMRLDDPDEFVRVTAVSNLLEIGGSERVLLDRFSERDDIKAPILRALLDHDKTPPEKLWSTLAQAPPGVILQCLNALEDRNDRQGKRLEYAARFAHHPNPDVAAAALRMLASKGRRPDLLLEALKSRDPVRQDAVLDDLHLRQGTFQAAGSSPAIGRRPDKPNPVIVSLFRLLGGETRAGGEDDASPAPLSTFVSAGLRAALEGFFRDGSPAQHFRSALALASQGDTAAAKWLLESIETFSSLERREIAGLLAGVSFAEPGPFRDLAARLLRDSAGDVREQAIEAWSDTDRPQLLGSLLEEFSRPDSLLAPDDIYGYSLDRLVKMPTNVPIVLDWGRRMLDDTRQPASTKVLAISLLGRNGQAETANVSAFLTDDNPWLRRAAYRALGIDAASKRINEVLADESAMVRAVLPFLAAPQSPGWLHWFDDARFALDAEDFDSERNPGSFGGWAQGPGAQTAPEIVGALEKLARDPSDHVRFEAMFALLRLGHPIDPAALARLVSAQPEGTDSRQRLGNFLESNYSRLGAGYGVLVPVASGISAENVPLIADHFGLGKAALTTFASLADLAQSRSPADAEASIAPPPATPAPRADGAFKVIFFFKPGCRECEQVRSMLNEHAGELPGMHLEEIDITERRNALLNEVLSKQFDIEETLHQVAPAVFTRAGAVVGREITFPGLGNLLRRAASLPPGDETWVEAAEPEIAAARTAIEERYEALSLGVVLAAGLLDGVNPCAFATIILLLSYLQVTRRTPREILAVGGAFVLAVFLSYFAVGLGLAQVLAKIAALRIAGTALTYTLAAFAAVIALLSFRDARIAARGQLGEMALQLPLPLKERIRTTIRTSARAPRFVAAAFGAGVVISFLELACTGQVYLPTILYMLRSGHAGAIGHLLVYNLAFITPLVVVFWLASAGMRSDALIRFQQRHTAAVKVLAGVLFLALAAFLLFGYDILPRAAGAH